MPEQENELKTKKKCFIITPIGDPNSDIRRQAEGVIDEVLCPVLVEPEFDYNVIVPHRVSDTGSITKQIITDIFDSDLVVANLTGLNANVMYELSFRHACGKPIIHICEAGTKLPFDLKDQRTIFYNNDMAGAFQLKTEFKKMMASILKSPQDDKDNPIHNSLKSWSFDKNIEKSLNDPATKKEEKLSLEILKELSKQVNFLSEKYDLSFNQRYNESRYFDDLKHSSVARRYVIEITGDEISEYDVDHTVMQCLQKQNITPKLLEYDMHEDKYLVYIDIPSMPTSAVNKIIQELRKIGYSTVNLRRVGGVSVG